MLSYFGRRSAGSINAKKCGEKLVKKFRIENEGSGEEMSRERSVSDEQDDGFADIFKKTQFCINEQNNKTNYYSQCQFVNHRIFNQLMTSEMSDKAETNQLKCKQFKFNADSIVYLISALDTTCGDSDKNKTNFILKKLNSKTNISAKKGRIKLDSFQCSFQFCTTTSISQKRSTSSSLNQAKDNQQSDIIIESELENISKLKNKKSVHFLSQEDFQNKQTNDSYFFGQKQNHIDQIIKNLLNQQVNMNQQQYGDSQPLGIQHDQIKIIELKNKIQMNENWEKSNEIIQEREKKKELSSNQRVGEELDQFQKAKLVQNQFNQLEIQQTLSKTATTLNEKTLLINTNKAKDFPQQEEQLQQIHKQQSISSTSLTNLTQRDSNCTISDNSLPLSPPEKAPESPLLSGSESPDEKIDQTQVKNSKSSSKKFDTASDSLHSESERCIPAGKSPIKSDKQQQQVRNKQRSNTYKIERKIGDGCSSVVYLAKEMDELSNILSSNLIAIKKFKKRKEHHFESEYKILSQINGQHPNIIKIQSINPSQMEIQSDYCPNGDLLDFVIKRGALKESQARFFFSGVSKAVQYLQQRNICHRDLKLENILLDAAFNPVVIDFAFASYNKPNLTDFLGTDGYQAPEIVLKYPYCGFAADNFSLGVMLFEMIMGKPPFQHAKLDQGLYKKFIQENIEYWEVFKKYASPSEEVKDLINKLLSNEPSNRISIDDVLQHPWMKQSSQVEQMVI